MHMRPGYYRAFCHTSVGLGGISMRFPWDNIDTRLLGKAATSVVHWHHFSGIPDVLFPYRVSAIGTGIAGFRHRL